MDGAKPGAPMPMPGAPVTPMTPATPGAPVAPAAPAPGGDKPMAPKP